MSDLQSRLPPMMMTFLSLDTMVGSMRIAIATFVRGAVASSVTSPVQHMDKIFNFIMLQLIITTETITSSGVKRR